MFENFMDNKLSLHYRGTEIKTNEVSTSSTSTQLYTYNSYILDELGTSCKPAMDPVGAVMAQ